MNQTSKSDILLPGGLICVVGGVAYTASHWTAFLVILFYLQIWIFLKTYQSNSCIRRVIGQIRAIRYGQHDYPVQDTSNRLATELAREFNLIYAALDRERLHSQMAHSNVENSVWQRTQQLNQQLKQVARSAQIDELSGLSNRKHFEQRSREMFEEAIHGGNDLSYIMIDVDHFKETNDQWGHAAGDRIISFIGQLLNATTRTTDLSARFGGDEFVLMLANCPAKNAAQIADRLRRHFAREVENYIQTQCQQPVQPHQILPGLSIGLASIQRDRPLSIEQLKHMADSALYKAKEKGRNQIAAYA